MYLRIILLAVTILLFSCGGGGGSSSSPQPDQPTAEVSYDTLREATEAKSGIFVGSLYNDGYMQHNDDDATYRTSLATHFNMMSLEYSIAMEEIWEDENTINFTRPDVAFDYARANNMAVRVSHLLWYSTIPEWLSAGSYSDAEIENLIQGYITTVMSHYITNYPDVYTEWNVVNEAVSHDSPTELRDTFFVQKLGTDYIAKAFQWAEDVSSDAKLYINDYGCIGSTNWNNSRKATLLSIVNDLISRDIHIDGIGFQGHFAIEEYNDIEAIRSDFADYADLGLELAFTEIDIRINDDLTGQTAAKEQIQSDLFKDIYQLCVDTPECKSVSLWGLADHLSFMNTGYADWLDQDVDWPLLIDENMQTKDVYDEIIEILAGQ